MANVMPFRPFKLTNVVESGFIQDSPFTPRVNKQFAEEDLARSGLTMEDIGAVAPTGLRLADGALAGYTIPYFGLDGQPIVDDKNGLLMFRVRFKYPEHSKASRYTQPSSEQLGKHGLPSIMPYLHPLSFELPLGEGNEVICCEGEKKTAAVLKHIGQAAFGISGCRTWHDPKGTGKIHPMMEAFLRTRGVEAIAIVPDGDVKRYDICAAYGTFAHAATQAGFRVRILNPDGKIDDLLVEWGPSAKAQFISIPALDKEGLVQDTMSLVRRFGLGFDQIGSGDKMRAKIRQNHANVSMILAQYHEVFPPIWMNRDKTALMFGDEEAVEGKTDMEITNYFQHNLGFSNIKPHVIQDCMLLQAKTNMRSPFLDEIRGYVWDGVKRLETWMSDYWGVPDSPYAREVSKKWLVSSCARLDKPGTKIDWMLITIGGQGTGKTSMPSIMFGEHYGVIVGEHTDQTMAMMFSSKLCLGFDEMDTVDKKSISLIKSWVTNPVDVVKLPYGRKIESLKRRSILYGCGNKTAILQYDPSGQRRYAVIEVPQKLDFPGLEAAREQLWAEAWYIYTGEQLDYWDVKDNSANAEKYTVESPLKNAIEEFLLVMTHGKLGEQKVLYFLTGQVLEHLGLGKLGGNSSQMRDITDILSKLGCIKATANWRHPGTGGQGKWWTYEVQTNTDSL